MHSIKILMKQQ